MSSSITAGKAAFLAFAAISIASCNSENGSGNGNSNGSSETGGAEVGSSSVEVWPERVDQQALRSVASDDQVRSFYEAGDWQAVWDRRRAGELMHALERSGAHGLSTDSFIDGELPDDPTRREATLTKAALEYASALADGFVDPTEIRDIYTVPRPETDVVQGLRQAVSAGQVGRWLASLPPQTDEYRALSREFLNYARQAQSGESSEIQSGDLIKEGDSDQRVPRLVEALASNGYLDRRQLQQPDPQTYTPQIAQAVEQMQDDFGLASDGVVGPDTLQALNTGARDRARQLAVNLERLRWLEREPPETRIDVNTAATFLDYWRDGRHRDHRKVVVGEPGWETPALGSPIYRLVANPTWTVPKSIEEDELADRGAAYLRANNMERRDGFIVQLPGEDNALGDVKFDMQNDHAIYLHDTPAKALFAENERHRSHGCVRVEDAPQFAQMLAEHDGIVSEYRQAQSKSEESFVDLKSDIPVRLLYHTAFLDRSGKVQFRTDAYGWDEDVARALGREARESRTVRAHERGRDVGP